MRLVGSITSYCKLLGVWSVASGACLALEVLTVSVAQNRVYRKDNTRTLVGRPRNYIPTGDTGIEDLSVAQMSDVYCYYFVFITNCSYFNDLILLSLLFYFSNIIQCVYL
jgi:hypothetical protein